MKNIENQIIGIIPARYASTRFPGKPMADIQGITMIERVYRQVIKSKYLKKVVVATDNENIYNHVISFGGEAQITDSNHISGTDRCLEAFQNEMDEYDFVINIQGDEPFIQPEQIDLLAQNMALETEIATLYKKITDKESVFNANIPKVIFNNKNEAIYFSRHPIPFIRGLNLEEWHTNYVFYKHIGIYGFRSDILIDICKLNPSKLEQAESLEQLRWLENGFKISVIETETETFGIDTPEDILKLNQNL